MANTSIKEKKEFLKYAPTASDVVQGTEYWIRHLLEKACGMFGYTNLPSTLNDVEIESNFIMKGFGVALKKYNKIWIPFETSLYGFDAYNTPNQYVYANPRLGSGRGFDLLDKTAVFGWNTETDKLFGGSRMMETIRRYANLLAQVESTIYFNQVNDRMQKIGVAPNQQVAEDMNNTFINYELGKPNSIQSQDLIGDTRTLDFSSSVHHMGEVTATRDYLLNCFYNEIGLQTLEEKKERMISTELEVDQEVLHHNIRNMYESRQEFVAKLNYTFKDLLSKPIEVYLKKGGV